MSAILQNAQETSPAVPSIREDGLAACERQIAELAERLRKLEEVFSPESLKRQPKVGIVSDLARLL